MQTRKLKFPELTKEVIYQEWVINRLSQREIGIKYNVSTNTIESKISTFKLTRIRSKIKYVLDSTHINLQSPIFWYLVGLVISDGCIDEKNKRIKICLTNDYEILLTLSSLYSTLVKIPVFAYQSNTLGKVLYNLDFSSEELINLFHSIRITGINKTSTVIMPDPGNLYLFNFLLRGFIDGDGSIRLKGQTECLEFRFYIHSNNLIANLVYLYKKYYNYDLAITPRKGKTGRNVGSKVTPTDPLIEIYSDIPQLALKRKREIIQKRVDDIVHRYEMINHSNW